MHLPLLSLLTISLALALPSQDPDFKLPPAFAHLLPSIPGTEAEIGKAVQAALKAQPIADYSRWLLFGVRVPSTSEEWGFVAVYLRASQPYVNQGRNQEAVFVAPPSYGDREYRVKVLSDVVRQTHYHLVLLKSLKSLKGFSRYVIAPVEAALAYETNLPRDVWYWYDQFFRAVGVDVSQGPRAE